MDKLVSIITPCLNGEKFVHRLLDSVLEQTYSNIEHIFVDDGSIDRTAEIIKQYIPKYKQNGKKLIYLFQENTGQAGALNNALKFFKGDYLTWPDSDDFYRTSDALSNMVKTFENLTADYGMVRCDAMLLDENTLIPLSKFSDNNPNVFKEDLFDDCILENQFWFAPICYMTSKVIIDEVIRNRNIFVNTAGQNWQMFLPILYNYKCKYINDTLINYLVREDSHSRNKSFESAVKQSHYHEQILNTTIMSITMDKQDLNKYLLMLEKKYIFQRLNISFYHSSRQEFNHYFLKLENSFPEEIILKLRIKKIILRMAFVFDIVRKIKNIKIKH